jgi:hypothetical protein
MSEYGSGICQVRYLRTAISDANLAALVQIQWFIT